MKRRDFIRKGFKATAFAGASLAVPFNNLWASPLPFFSSSRLPASPPPRSLSTWWP